MGCGASSPADRPSYRPGPAPAARESTAATGDTQQTTAAAEKGVKRSAEPSPPQDNTAEAAGDGVVQPSPPPAPSKAAVYAADGLASAAALIALAPFPASAPLSSVLRRCATLISSSSSRPQWLADFHAYLSEVDGEVTAAAGVCRLQSYLQSLTAEMNRAEQSLQEITKRSWLAAAVHSAEDARTLQSHRDQCERIKQQALMAMLSETKADSNATTTQAQQIKAVLDGTASGSTLGVAAPTEQAAAATPTPLSDPATAASSSAASSSSSSAPESALSSLSSALAFVPLASAASLSASLDRCLGMIASIRSRGQWLAEFERYLTSVRGDLASASAAFSRSSGYLTALSAQLAQAEKLLRSIAGRPAWKAPLYAAGDRQSLQSQQAACEKIKSEALSAMLTEMQADSTAVRSIVAKVRRMLAASEQAAQELRMAHDRMEAEGRLLARLQPIDFTSDVDRELERFMPGTRANIISAVNHWLRIGGPATAAATTATTTPAAASKGLTDASSSSSPSEPTPAASAAPPSASSAPASTSCLFWIRGGPGAGKSCVSAKLIDCYSSEIVAVHFCRHDSADRRDPRRLVKSIAHQLAQRLPLYAEKLRAAIPAVFGTDATTDTKSASDLWAQLLVAPLHAIGAEIGAERTACGRKYALLVDALDEASLSGTAGSGSSDLLTLLASSAADLPAWLGIIVTSRPEAAIVTKLSRYTPLKMECDSDDNLSDLRSFFTHCLRQAHAPAAQRVSADDSPALPNESALVDLLMAKSAGLFLLGRMMMEQHDLLRVPSSAADASFPLRDFAVDPMRVEEVAAWPAGLDAFYFTCMRRVRASIVAAGGRGAAPVESAGRVVPRDLSVLLRITAFVLCAEEPLSLGCIAEMFELRDAAAAFRLLAPVRAIMPVATPEGLSASAAAATAVSPHCTVSVYHKSVRDWFLSPVRLQEAAVDADAVYAIDEPQTHATMTEACWLRLVDASCEPFVVSALSLALPALCVDEICAPADSHPNPKQASLPSSFLRYAVAFGPTHGLSCSGGFVEAASVCAFLCHPQYLHMRCFVGQGVELSGEYLNAKAKLAACASPSASASAASPAPSSSTQSAPACSSLWISHLSSPSSSLSLFHRAYQSYSAEWFREPELVYQYAANFPDDTPVAQLAQACLPWFRAWPHRTHTIAQWETKPAALADLLSVFHFESMRCMAVSHDGSRLLTGEATAIRIRNAETFAVESSIALPSSPHEVHCLAVSPDGRWIGVGLVPNSSKNQEGPTWVLVFDASDASLVCQFAGHLDRVISVQFDPTSTLLLSKDSSKQTIVQISSVRENRVLHSWPSGAYGQNAIACFSESPGQILLLNQNYSPHLEVRAFSGAILHTLPDSSKYWANASGSKVVSCTWHPDAPKDAGFSFAITTVTGELVLPIELVLPLHNFSSCDWSPDGRWLALYDGLSIGLHSAATGERLCEFLVSGSGIEQVLFSPDCTRLFVRSKEGAFGILVFSTEAASRAQIAGTAVAPASVAASAQPAQRSLPPVPAAAPTAAVSAVPVAAVLQNLKDLQLTSDGRLAVVDDAAVRLLDPQTGAQLQQFRRSAIVQCASDGQTYVVAGDSATPSVSGSFTAVSLAEWDGDATCSALSDDCSLMAVGRMRDVRVFRVATGAVMHEFWCQSVSFPRAVRFSRDGQRLAVGHDSGQFRVWDLRSSETERPWRSRLQVSVDRPQSVVSLEWNADDTQILLLLASSFRFVWNGDSACCGVEIRSPAGSLLQQVLSCPHFARQSLFISDCSQPSLNCCAWNPQHSRIAACNNQPALILWDNAGRVLHSIRMHSVGRCVVWRADGKAIYTLSVDSALRCHMLPESLFAPPDAASGSLTSRSASRVRSAASFDDAAFHRIAYED